MASKKYKLFLGLMCLFASATFAQVGSSYDVKDSSMIPAKRQPQHNEFLNNAYPFPAMPRNQWEVGVKAGTFTIFGDVPAIFPTFGFGAHVRKAFGYVFSLRAEFMYGVGKGLSWKKRTAGFSQAQIAAGYTNANSPNGIFDNYKTTNKDLDLEGIFTLNNVRFHKAKNGVSIYGIAGIGATWFHVKTNLKDANGNLYNYSGITNANIYKDRHDVRKQLKALLDGSYESDAESDLPGKPKLGNNTLVFNVNTGFGVAFKLNKKWNLALEDRITMPLRTDLMDGVRNQNTGTYNSNVLSPDYDVYNYFTVGLNYNLGKKSVEPLWWLNPLDYAYNELNAPRHMKFPKPVLDDADGDGVTDQFDHEPNTPAGCPVDSHGVSRDTDGDGVPDCKDKELITPTQCQPVDADGVGKCPPPACCDELGKKLDSLRLHGTTGCGIGDLPSVSFKEHSIALSNDAKAVLASVAEKMRQHADCKVAVIGYGESNKAAQQLSWDRVNAVISYLVEKEGVSQDRFIFRHSQEGGDGNTVDLKDGTGAEGPSTVPAPHPNLRKKK